MPSSSILSTSITTLRRTLFSPLFITLTSPLHGETYEISGASLWQKSGVPLITLSPALTSILGFRPLKSGPSTATEFGTLLS